MKINRLRGRLGALQISISEFARRMEFSRMSAVRKLDGVKEFTASEIHKACEILAISTDKIPYYFFDESEEDED